MRIAISSLLVALAPANAAGRDVGVGQDGDRLPQRGYLGMGDEQCNRLIIANRSAPAAATRC